MRGSKVKNIILGMIGVFISIYTLLIGLDILMYQTSKNQIEKQVSRIVKHVLETNYQRDDVEMVKQMMTEEILSSFSKNGTIKVEIEAIDLEKGLLSVSVTKQIQMLNGKEKEIRIEKTAIVDRVYVDEMELEVS